jgi:hypothetical protein
MSNTQPLATAEGKKGSLLISCKLKSGVEKISSDPFSATLQTEKRRGKNQ